MPTFHKRGLCKSQCIYMPVPLQKKFVEKTFAEGGNTTQFFSHESFWLLGQYFALVFCMMCECFRWLYICRLAIMMNLNGSNTHTVVWWWFQMRTEGPRAMFRGITPILLRAFPANAVSQVSHHHRPKCVLVLVRCIIASKCSGIDVARDLSHTLQITVEPL